MNAVEVKQIEEENYHLLKARCMLLDSTGGHQLVSHEASYHSLYESLSDEEIRELSRVDFSLFSLNIDPSDLRDIVSNEINYKTMDDTERLVYESNILILSNRWQKAITKHPNEINFTTKRSVYEALARLTFSELQVVARRNKLLTKIVITDEKLKHMLLFSDMRRDERNRIIVTG
ncbi:hypothetical protein [Comamonas thiooxydans]|uniref:hypothetical protein n=1 Tax=Comamonas thiooxydans TaxID=363952 RepID=UPI0010408ABA|nr:hypothetical protein [Comamonas thiooxydans]